MGAIEATFGLLLAALIIALLAKRVDKPYPIALVLGGVALAEIPGIPRIQPDPELVLYLLLPPILTEAAYFTSWRDFWFYRRPIFLLAFGLVMATSALVAALCVWLIPGMNWAAGFALGAIVSPPDAAAATAITRGVRLPRRIVQILEGESLVNDAAGLTIYRFAVLAIVTSAFSFSQAVASFAWITLGGIGMGLFLGWGFVRIYPHLKDPDVEILATFVLSYVSYWAAEAVHASGVMSTVTAGLILGRHSSVIFSASGRIRGTAVWQSFIFLINVVIFTLIGLELPPVLESLSDYPAGLLLLWNGAIVAGVILIRLVWVFLSGKIARLFPRRLRTMPDVPKGELLVVGWTGLRGVVSMAAALALPHQTASGLPFPYRNLILLVTFSVILVTLLLQGLTLRSLICLVRLPEDRSSEEEQLKARIHAAERVLERLSELESESAAPEVVVVRIRGYYEDRLTEMKARLEAETGSAPPPEPARFQSLAEQRLWWEVAKVERTTILALRRNSEIGDEAMHQIERDIDLLEARIVPR